MVYIISKRRGGRAVKSYVKSRKLAVELMKRFKVSGEKTHIETDTGRISKARKKRRQYNPYGMNWF